MYIENFGHIIYLERKSWGMSKRKLAKLAFVDVETIEEIESGVLKNPDFFLMLNICDKLEISVFELLKDNNLKRRNLYDK